MAVPKHGPLPRIRRLVTDSHGATRTAVDAALLEEARRAVSRGPVAVGLRVGMSLHVGEPALGLAAPPRLIREASPDTDFVRLRVNTLFPPFDNRPFGALRLVELVAGNLAGHLHRTHLLLALEVLGPRKRGCQHQERHCNVHTHDLSPSQAALTPSATGRTAATLQVIEGYVKHKTASYEAVLRSL